jgi:hypothetical protein
MEYELAFLKALLITISVETLVLFILFKTAYKSASINKWMLLFTGILASMTTLPYAWFILPIFIKTKLYYVIISELSVTALESLIIWGTLRTNYTRAFTISIICNAASFLVGLLLHF